MSDFWEYQWPVRKIITHERPHLDELAAAYALRHEGREHFPGIEESKFVVFDPEIHQDDRTEEEWLEEENVLFVGVRGGRFDDHPHHMYMDKCTLTQVLTHLGKRNHRGWKRINAEVTREDRNGTNVEFHLARLVKQVGRFGSINMAYDLVASCLESFLAAQESYQEALRIVSEAQQMVVKNQPSNADFTLCWVDRCDNEDFSRAARTRRKAGGLEAALVIHRSSGGNVYISSNQYLGIKDVSHLARALRLAEQSHDTGVTENRREMLEGDGDGFGWYHQKQAAALFNGSMCHQHVAPTRVPLNQIVALAKDFLRNTKLRPTSRR